MVYILFFVDRPTGQTGRRIFTHDGSNDAVSRKGVPFLGVENSKLISNPRKIPPKSKIWPKTGLRNSQPKTLLYKNFTYKRPLIVIVGP